ncbi:MAG: hypothetical protein WBG37_12435 [Desulfobacterales bacterium]|jgi:hypothetical protein
MKTALTAVLLLAILAGPAHGQELIKLSLDDLDAVTPRIEADASMKTEGRQALKITTHWPATIHLGEVTGIEAENAKLIYRAKVRSDLKGTVFLEMWAHLDGGQYFSKGINDALEGTSDWKTLATPFMFQKGQNPDKITLNLVINGTGTVWVDEIVLVKEPLG